MKLEDLNPRPSKFHLSYNDKWYTMRAWTLNDQIWMNQEYGDRINEIFSEKNLDIVAIARMAYRLLEEKNDFKAREFVTIDEEGNEETQKIGGYKLLIARVKTIKEQLALLAAVVECIGLSMPEVDEIKNMGSGKVDPATEKKTSMKPTGARL